MLVDVVTAPQENRKPGVNPGRYRRCMRGGATLDESRSLGKPEKAVWSLGCASQKNCSNEVKPHGSASTEPVIFCCGKTAAAAFGSLRLFCSMVIYVHGRVPQNQRNIAVDAVW